MKIWATSDDNSVEYVSLTAENFDGALKVLRHFYQFEAACSAVGLSRNDAAMDEMDDFVKAVANEGVSIVAVDRKTNTVCGVAFNKLQELKDSDEDSDFHNFSKTCKQTATKDVIEFMHEADAQINIFNVCKVDCLLEIMYLSTLPNFSRRGIASQLCKSSTELAKLLKENKENIKHAIDGRELPLGPIPKAVCAIFTGNASRRIGRKLNWTIAGRLSYDKFHTCGKSFDSLIPADNTFCSVEYLKI